MSSKKILVAAHVTEVYGPVQALINFLKRSVTQFTVITHPFSYSSIQASERRVYKNGEIQSVKGGLKLKKPEPLVYVKDFVYNLFFTLSLRTKFDIFIGIDNLNAFSGIILRKLGIVDKVVFYVIDYSPKRFENTMMNQLYHSLDKFCVKNSDYVWNISERIAKIREEQGIEKEKNLVVGVGVELEKIKHVYPEQIDRYKLVFVSHLTKTKGAQLIIDAMEDITKKISRAKLEIIGTGPYEPELKKMVEEKGLKDHIKFMGVMDHETLLKYLPTCGVAIATYEDDPNSITYYADPTKPKEYLACGLPLIITRVPWIAEEVEKREMGIAINYNKDELVNASVKLLTDIDFYTKCEKTALKFVSELSWDRIYDDVFFKCIRSIKE